MSGFMDTHRAVTNSRSHLSIVRSLFSLLRLLRGMSSHLRACLLHCIKFVVGIKMISAPHPKLKESKFTVFPVLVASMAMCAGALESVCTALAPQTPHQSPQTPQKY